MALVEFKDLPDTTTPLDEDNLNNNFNELNNDNVYSTSEIDTGKKWIDGKPIYRKVVQYTMIENPGYYPAVSTGLSNIGNAIITIERQYGTNNSQYISAITGYNGYLNKSDGTFIFNRTNTDPTKPEPGAYNIIIEYTKTTD